MDVAFERQGKLNVASQPWQVDGLRSMQRNYERFGIDCQYVEGVDLKAYLDSPDYVAGVFEPNYALLNPVKMVTELRRVCLAQGVQLFEHSPVSRLREDGTYQVLETGLGTVRADKVALATNIAPPLLGTLKSKVIPIYDYALATQPLDDEQLRAIGWVGRYGIADSGNQFHYLRKTEDNRILWGGYDAIYHFGSRRDEALTQRPDSFATLARQFQAAFPALVDVRFSHAWGGIIDTSARTTMFCGTASNGRVAYAQGFTGQGVSASRFAALTLLDLLEGKATERTKLAMTSTAPFPFPPSPCGTWACRWPSARWPAKTAPGTATGCSRGSMHWASGLILDWSEYTHEHAFAHHRLRQPRVARGRTRHHGPGACRHTVP